MSKKKIIYYALYNNEDECIVTFDKIKDLGEYLGYKKGKYLSTVMHDNFKPIVELQNPEMTTELLYIYQKEITLPDNTVLKKGSKIYRFIEEVNNEQRTKKSN